MRLLTQVLLVPPQGNRRADYLRNEAQELLHGAPWYRVYDLAEAIYLRLAQLHEQQFMDPAPHLWFERELNEVFLERGIGWRMSGGMIEFRGPEPLEADVQRAADGMEQTGRHTAATELREARLALSRRPEPNLTGAVRHALASLECLSRDLVGDPQATFGEILGRYPDLLPQPLRQTANTLWGYASEFARHVREGRVPTMADAVFVVGVASSFAAFLIEREVADVSA